VGWGSDSAEIHEILDKNLGRAIEACKRVNGHHIGFSSSREPALAPSLRVCRHDQEPAQACTVAEKAGVQLCIEHVNAPRLPDRLLQHIADAYMMACAAAATLSRSFMTSCTCR